MKRLLALLLCLALLLPVFSLAESDEDDWDIEDLDIEDLDIDGEEDDEDAIGSEEDTDDDWSNFPDDDQDTIINYDELEINRNCPDEVINILLIGVDTRGNEDRNTDSKLLKIRIFKDAVARRVYKKQTDAATVKGVSNCPDCVLAHDANSKRIYAFGEMEADHVSAWSRGGDTTEANCQMLCKHHNRVKGNC